MLSLWAVSYGRRKAKFLYGSDVAAPTIKNRKKPRKTALKRIFPPIGLYGRLRRFSPRKWGIKWGAETTIKELKQEVKAIIDNYDPDARPRDCEGCSLPHGSRTPTSGGYDFEDTILELVSVGAAPCGPFGVRFAQAT